MTRTRAEKITGLLITVIQLGGSPCALGIDPVTKAVEVQAWAKTESRALKLLIERAYAIRRQEVFKKAGWRCERCGGLLSLQADHKVPRSKGRDDRIGNLRALCSEHHDERHR